MGKVKSHFMDMIEFDGIDPDEPTDLPGPAHGTYGYNDEDRFDVDVDENGPFITTADEDEEDLEKAMNDRFDFDKYCEENPDFNAALNGHWEHI